VTTPPAKVELLTARMVLRPVGLDDLDDFHRIVTSPGVHEGTLTFPQEPDEEWSRARLERVMERVDRQECFFVHAHLRDAPAAGAIANLSLDIVGAHARGHLGYMVDQRHRGQGYATEMLTAVVKHAFDGLGLHRVCANTWTWNDASSKLLARVGFAREGRSRQHYLKDDEYIDADDWGMLASDPRPWKD
jgi:ribosomal-protein-alanine N-acetyltransferase